MTYDRDDKFTSARELCLKFGAIKACKRHPHIDIDLSTYADAKTLAAAIRKKYPRNDCFNSHDEMVDYLQEALNDAGMDCTECDPEYGD